MKKNIFDDFKNVLEEVNNVFNEVELPVEDKIIFSPEMSRLIKEEIFKEISNIPIGKIVSNIISKELERRIRETDLLKETILSNVSKEISKLNIDSKNEFNKEIREVKTEIENNFEKLKKNLSSLRSELGNQALYQFGGFSPPNPSNKTLNSVLTNTNGTWAGLDWVVSSGGGLPPGTFTVSNNTPSYTFDPTADTIDNLYQVVATLIRKLQGEI